MFKGERDVETCLLAAGADLDVGTPSAREMAALFGRELDESPSSSRGHAPAQAVGPMLRQEGTA